MPVSRMRMRPWLVKMIETNAVPGLRWVDQEKTTFVIPWKHAARHGWELDRDASLFKMWAIHTGKYVEGGACDPKIWKANFRCAMNSLPDIEEVKDKSVNKGHQAMRVFKMLPVVSKCKERKNRTSKHRSQAKVKCEEESSDSDCAPSPVQTTNFLSTPLSTFHSYPQETSSRSNDDVPEWSDMVEVEHTDLTRRFQVSPSQSPCPDDHEIIEICAEWERERWQNTCYSNGFLYNDVQYKLQCTSPGSQCTSPGSQSSEVSSADDLDEHTQYTTLSTSFSSPTDDHMTNFYPFSDLLFPSSI